MTNSEKQQWEKERVKGYDYFLLRGIVHEGLPFGILATLLRVLPPVFKHQLLEQGWVEIFGTFGFLTVSFGACMGNFYWRMKEKDYQKPTEEPD